VGELAVIEGGEQANATRLQDAREAVMRGYAEAVDILTRRPGRPAHPDLEWFEEGLADARQLAGLPRARGLEDAERR
jgi:hypothetical protein